ncbi:sugar phosphate isomerase/epimerase family protein [Brevibacillus brevis]|uniref:Sugar phosphate isomerase/epimerase family protein n=1 Tax=Brevibacillus brevis TaxID=1393 RepID=A0ABY9SZD8_BREBE|nr:sugar phosphate isomerase/epimerase family protein [Brevibacillus brevis]WNC12964.1 sugar phosphate isomerase/epimerase family protein [Brevibacillus brevis]
MKLAFSTNAFTRTSLKQAIIEIGNAGYSGVEILADVPHAFPPNPRAEWVQECKHLLQWNKLSISNINANTAGGFFSDPTGEPTFEPSLCNSNRETRKKRIHYTKQCMELAAELGAGNISITSGSCLPGNPPRQALHYLQESLKEILEHAEKSGINVGVEYEPGLLIENAEELLHLIEVMGSDRLGVNLDLGHSVVIGEETGEIIQRFGKRIWNIHLEDIDQRKHYHLIPGEGTIDFLKIANELRDIEYQGFVTIELYTYANDPVHAAKQSLSYLQPFFQ